jgi:hypothetical protein
MGTNRFFIILSGMIVFAACSKAPEIESKQREIYMKEGAEIVSGTGHVLTSQLKEKIASSGIVGAIDFCQIHALELTDSVANAYQKNVKRTALKLRNPANKPDVREKMVLKMMAEAHGRKETLGPVLDLHDNGAIYYYQPIMLQPLCLNCHGTPGKEITEETFNAIKRKYPKDKAMGFKEGEFRGMWSVRLKTPKP